MGNLEARFRDMAPEATVDAVANSSSVANRVANNPTTQVANKLKRDRRDYQRDLMRRRRAAAKLETGNAGRPAS